jgi:hypothetical protein
MFRQNHFVNKIFKTIKFTYNKFIFINDLNQILKYEVKN